MMSGFQLSHLDFKNAINNSQTHTINSNYSRVNRTTMIWHQLVAKKRYKNRIQAGLDIDRTEQYGNPTNPKKTAIVSTQAMEMISLRQHVAQYISP